MQEKTKKAVPSTEFDSIKIATATNAPVEQKQRVVIVDTLRGFALVGVLIANFTGYTDQQVPADILKSISSPFDISLMHFNAIFFEGKFMTLFSILFGYGFGIILAGLEKKNINPTPFFLRRMFWLFILGCIHTSFWWFDVLHLYAMSGIFLLLFRKASNKTILICAVLFMFVIPFCFSVVMRNQPDTFTMPTIETHMSSLNTVHSLIFSKPTGAAIIKCSFFRPTIYGIQPRHLGGFSFGYFLLRIKLFESIEKKKDLFRKIIVVTAPVAIAYFFIRWKHCRAR
jgi:uncharacterized protein